MYPENIKPIKVLWIELIKSSKDNFLVHLFCFGLNPKSLIFSLLIFVSLLQSGKEKVLLGCDSHTTIWKHR